MSDNIQLNAATTTGDKVRAVDRTTSKATVCLLDVGGQAGPESLVTTANPLPVSGTFFQATQPVSAASLPLPTGAATAALQTSGNASLVTIAAAVGGTVTVAGSVAVTNFPAGFLAAQSGTWTVGLTGAIPAGTNVIGHVVVDSAPTTAVTGTFWQATQPVSVASLPALAAGTAVIGHVIVDTAPTTAVTGTVTANAGTGTFAVSAASLPLPAGAATEATLSTLNGKVPALGQALAAASLPVVLTAAQITTLTPPASVGIAAGTALMGQSAVAQQVNQLYSGTTALTPKYATISAATSGDGNTVVAAVTSKKIVVLSYSGNVAGAVTVKFRDFDGASTYADLTGAMALLANQPLPGGGYCPVGLFATAAGHALTLNLSGAIQTSGRLTYVEV